SRDGRRLVIAGGDLASERTSVQIRDASTGEELRTISTPGQPTYFPSFSPDGTRVLAIVGGATSFDPVDNSTVTVFRGLPIVEGVGIGPSWHARRKFATPRFAAEHVSPPPRSEPTSPEASGAAD